MPRNKYNMSPELYELKKDNPSFLEEWSKIEHDSMRYEAAGLYKKKAKTIEEKKAWEAEQERIKNRLKEKLERGKIPDEYFKYSTAIRDITGKRRSALKEPIYGKETILGADLPEDVLSKMYVDEDFEERMIRAIEGETDEEDVLSTKGKTLFDIMKERTETAPKRTRSTKKSSSLKDVISASPQPEIITPSEPTKTPLSKSSPMPSLTPSAKASPLPSPEKDSEDNIKEKKSANKSKLKEVIDKQSDKLKSSLKEKEEEEIKDKIIETDKKSKKSTKTKKEVSKILTPSPTPIVSETAPEEKLKSTLKTTEKSKKTKTSKSAATPPVSPISPSSPSPSSSVASSTSKLTTSPSISDIAKEELNDLSKLNSEFLTKKNITQQDVDTYQNRILNKIKELPDEALEKIKDTETKGILTKLKNSPTSLKTIGVVGAIGALAAAYNMLSKSPPPPTPPASTDAPEDDSEDKAAAPTIDEYSIEELTKITTNNAIKPQAVEPLLKPAYVKSISENDIKKIDDAVAVLQEKLSNLSYDLPKSDQQIFLNKLDELDKKYNEAYNLYEKRKDRIEAAQVFDILAKAVAQLFVGLHGMNTGYDISGLKFEPIDWERKIDRLFAEFDKTSRHILEQKEGIRRDYSTAREEYRIAQAQKARLLEKQIDLLNQAKEKKEDFNEKVKLLNTQITNEFNKLKFNYELDKISKTQAQAQATVLEEQQRRLGMLNNLMKASEKKIKDLKDASDDKLIRQYGAKKGFFGIGNTIEKVRTEEMIKQEKLQDAIMRQLNTTNKVVPIDVYEIVNGKKILKTIPVHTFEIGKHEVYLESGD